MAKRERTAKFLAFGTRLKQWRGGMSVDTAARMVQRMNVDFDAATLRGWEYGWTGRPDPLRLLALARVYNVPMDEVMTALRESRGQDAGGPITIPPEDTSPQPVTGVSGFVAVPLLRDPIAAGHPLVVEQDPANDYSLAFREDLIAKFKGQVICLRVGRREESMYPTILPGDVVLVDRREAKRRQPVNGGIYAVNFAPLTGHDGGALKRVEIDGKYLIISSENPDKTNDAYRTKAFDVDGKDVRDILQGEVVWFGRYMGVGRGR